MKKLFKSRRKKRGISPVIATVLLIGLVVVAGLGVAIVMFGTINTPDPLGIEVLGFSSFETTDNDIKIDKFDITLQNTERTNIEITEESFSLFSIDRTLISGWSMDQSSIILPGLGSETIELSCDNTVDQSELTPENDTIYIEVTIYPQGKVNSRSGKTIRSDIFKVGDTYGPVSLVSRTPITTFSQSGLIMNFSVINNGSLALDLRLEFSTASSSGLYFLVNDVNTSQYIFVLGKYETSNFFDQVFQVNSSELTVPGEPYLIFVSLLDNETSKLLAIETLSVTYQPI